MSDDLETECEVCGIFHDPDAYCDKKLPVVMVMERWHTDTDETWKLLAEKSNLVSCPFCQGIQIWDLVFYGPDDEKEEYPDIPYYECRKCETLAPQTVWPKKNRGGEDAKEK